MNILSLGAGVQSSAVFLMSVRGDLPKLDCAIFADTQWEPAAVYAHLEWLEEQGAAAGIPIHRVTKGNIREDAVISQVGGGEGGRFASMPLYVLNNGTDKGMIRRQCTREYKIEPIERFIKTAILGLDARARWPKEHRVRQWFGISIDEFGRTRSPSVRRKGVDVPQRWKSHYYPLCGVEFFADSTHEWTGERRTREWCHQWLVEHYPDRDVPRSACIGCPFHSNEEWRWLRDRHPDEWADAVDVDQRIRRMDKMDGEVFLHRDCVPLEDVDLTAPDEGGLFAECEGMCGV